MAYLTGPIAQGREGYYQAAVDAGGEPAGLWYGAGAEALGLRGEVDNDVLEAVFTHFLDPTDEASRSQATWGEARTLGAAARRFRSADAQFREMLSREPGASPERRAELQREAEANARQAVMFFDLTFSPGKDVTVLGVAFERAANVAREAGDTEAGEAWAAMHRAVERAVLMGGRASIDYMQEAAGYSRVGDHASRAGRWVDAHAFVVAQFLQHDSREKDPQLHVHQAVLNKVLCADGQWRSLDSKALHMLRGAAGAVGERVMEAELTRTLGVRFETRPDGQARQIVGVDQAVMDLFSSRRRAISEKAEQACRDFATYRGREPSALERTKIYQEMALSSRKSKSHEAEDPVERLERWERECQQALSGGLAQVAHNALHAGAVAREAWSVQDVLDRAVDRVAKKKGSWTRGDLMRAVSDVLPANLGVAPENVLPLLEQLADKALAAVEAVTPQERTDDLPAELRLANGASAFARPHSVKYAAPQQFAAERALRAAAVERGAAAMAVEDAQAFIARFAENGKELGADQLAAVLGVLTSAARVEVISAAAGAGKSFTVGAIADAWRSTGRQVYGLAPGQAQADILTAEGLPSWNTTAWLGGRDVPALQAGDIVVVDEASMASTQHLADVLARVRAADAKLVLVGDRHQLGAVGAGGGGFADVEDRAARYELTEVRRFSEEWEKTASLRLRAHDPAVLDEYDKHGRIRAAGTQEQAASAAARAWLADTVAGKEALLVVGSNKDAYRVSAELRAELVRLGRVQADGVRMGMDQNTAGVGDLVQGRRNGWELRGWAGNERCPINREAYKVVAVREDGGLTVEPAKGGPVLQLPASYVDEHLTLAYASTIHAAEGRTVDTAHGVVHDGTAANALYVQLTRGRDGNTAWVVTRHTDQAAPVGDAQYVEHRTALSVCAGILERAEDSRSALGEKAEEEEKAASVMTALERLSAAAAQFTESRTSQLLDLAAATGAITDEQRVRLAADPAMEGLARVLRQAEVAGHEPADVLHRALQGRSLDSATSPAAVLHHRIREATDLVPRLQSAHDLVPRGLPEKWQPYFSRLANDADTRRQELGAQAVSERPVWAVEALGPVPEDEAAREAWRSRAGWAAASREADGYQDAADPLGAAPPAGLAEKYALWRTAHFELALPDRSPEEAALSDGALRNRVAAHQRECAWAPRYVRDELAATSERVAQLRADATLWAGRAAHEDLPDIERAQLREAAKTAARDAAELAEREALLREADQARTEWFLHTAQTRDRAERAKVELGVRGVALTDPGDRVYADEWLAAEAQARAEDDAHRAIDEAALAENVPVDALSDDVVLETAVEDIRATAKPDAAEFADQPAVRRVPTADEVAETVARARQSLLEREARDADAATWEPAAEWQPAPVQTEEGAASRVRV